MDLEKQTRIIPLSSNSAAQPREVSLFDAVRKWTDAEGEAAYCIELDVRSSDVFTRRLHGTLAAAAERGPVDFPELLLTPGVGARTVQSLAMVAEVVHGAPYRFADPARFSLAHGGKDRHPYPVPIKVYDETIRVLKSAVQNAKLGREEELQTLRRLDDQARQLEKNANGPSFEDFVAAELKASPALGGRSVFGWEEDLAGSQSLPVK
jgi:hypothetical protein